MSSINSSTSTNSNSALLNQKPPHSKSFVCPNCNHEYDLCLRHNSYMGKIPLILRCKHTMCEECVKASLSKQEISCKECGHLSTVSENDKRQLQEIFPVNFYIIGLIHYTKRNIGEQVEVNLKLSGLSFKNQVRNKAVASTSELVGNLTDFTDNSILQEKCSQQPCNKFAAIRCFDCDEVYCKLCCQSLHKAARGLQTHRTISLSTSAQPEITETCSTHSGYVLDFFCSTCDSELCCYCVIHDHQGHDCKQLTVLDSANRTSFENLIQNAEAKWKKLLFAYKRVNEALARTDTITAVSSTDIEISKYFTNLHAALQLVERKLREDASTVKKTDFIVLNNINAELCNSIRVLNNLIISARNVTNSNFTKKINVQALIKKLENALDLPCYLLGKDRKLDATEFISEDILSGLEKCFIKTADTTNSFQLVGEADVPDGYDTTVPNDPTLTDLSCASFMSSSPPSIHDDSVDDSVKSSPLKSCDVLMNALKSKNSTSSPVQSIADWVKTVNEVECKMPSFNIGDRHKIMVTHIDTPERFYVQLVSLNDNLQQLSRDIKQYIRNIPAMVKNPELNQRYLVKYGEKGLPAAWYRGRIIDIIDNKLYRVSFIDYGNQKDVDISMLREIDSSLAKLKSFAIQCKLFNLYPKDEDWQVQAINLMGQMITGTEVAMVIKDKSGDILEVDLIAVCNSDGCSVRDALLFIGYANTCFDLETVEKPAKQPRRQKLHFRNNFNKDQSLKVVLSNVISPNKLYVQEAEYVYQIEHLNSQMMQHYTNKNRSQTANNDYIYAPKKDMAVAVHCNIEKWMWYRAIITETINGQGKVKVFLVDVGKIISTSYANIRRLPERFHALECQAILVRLTHIKPPNKQKTWDETAIQFLKTYSNNNTTLRMLIHDINKNFLQIALFESKERNDICINALMVKQNIAEATGSMAKQVEWINVELTTSQTNNSTESSYVFDLLDSIQTTNIENDDTNDEEINQETVRKTIRILRFVSPDLIYVALEDEKSTSLQLQLQNDLFNYYSNYTKKSQDWNTDDVCVVYRPDKKLYFRAVVLNKIDSLNFRVLLRDTAEEIIVSKQNIMKLENEFKQAIEGAFRCHLGGIIPAGDKQRWSCLAVEFLQDMFKKYTNIYLTKHGPIDKIRKSLPVIIWYLEYKHGSALEPSKPVLKNINNVLVDKGLAFKDRNLILLKTKQAEARVNSSGNAETVGDSLKNVQSHQDVNKIKSEKESNQQCKIQILKRDKSAPQNTSDVHLTSRKARSQSEKDSSADIVQGESHLRQSVSAGNSPLHSSLPHKLLSEEESSDSDWNKLYEIATNKLDEKQTETKNITEEALPDNTITCIPSTQTDWLAPIQFKKKCFYAYGTFVDDAASIYLHEIELQPVLKAMEKVMKEVFDNIPPEPIDTIWVPGQLCTVKYFMNNSWYRGKILDVNSTSIKVRMIDYGNEEECKHEDLRLKIMYIYLPAISNKICLHNVFPKANSTWFTSDMDELHKLVVEKKILVTLKEKIEAGISTPAIVEIGDIVINDYILTICPNLTKIQPNSERPNETVEDDDVIIEGEYSDEEISNIHTKDMTPESNSSEKYFSKIHLFPELIGKKLNIGVISILSYDNFIFEFLSDNVNESKECFNTISEDIKKNAGQQPIIDDLELGHACVAKYSEDGEWYRAEVLSLGEPDKDFIKVWFVDYGNFEDVPRDAIRQIRPEWLELPAIQCLGEIENIKLANEANVNIVFEFMSQFCGTYVTVEIISIDPLKVKLYDDNGELAYQCLLDKGILVEK